MTLNIELPDELAAALQSRAQEQGISPGTYVTRVLEDTLSAKSEQKPDRPFETGYGMWAAHGPAPSAEQIDENRREMFHAFAQDF